MSVRPMVADGGAALKDARSPQMKSGDIQFAKIGSSTLVIVESLRRFVEDRRVAHFDARSDGEC